MYLTKYKSGKREGTDRIAALVEITEGPCRGAGIWHSLSYGDALAPGRMNNFLASLTDGSKARSTLFGRRSGTTGVTLATKTTSERSA
jgi:hypothetical protein